MEMFVLTVIVLSGILCSFLLVMAARQIIANVRRKESCDWDIGDTVKIVRGLRSKAVRISGWCKDWIFYSDGGKTIRVARIWVLYNRSALWRRSYNECRGYMGRKPGFDTRAVELATDIESLSKEECQRYLKDCLSSEDYETADLIRKRIEKLE